MSVVQPYKGLILNHSLFLTANRLQFNQPFFIFVFWWHHKCLSWLIILINFYSLYTSIWNYDVPNNSDVIENDTSNVRMVCGVSTAARNFACFVHLFMFIFTKSCPISIVLPINGHCLVLVCNFRMVVVIFHGFLCFKKWLTWNDHWKS